MQPIHQLLSQIRWDPNFTGEFEIAYVDHMKDELQRVPVNDMRFEAADKFTFKVFAEDGQIVSIPLHRIRRVYRDGAIIWNRDADQ